MRRAAATWAGAVLALAGGCELPRTELVVRVDSELTWGAGRRVQSVVFTVRRGGSAGPLRDVRTTALRAGAGLPLYVGVIASGDDLDALVWVEALGCGDAGGCTAATAVVAQRALVGFVRGQTQELPLLLASACAGVTCRGDERCAVNGRCEPATAAQATVRPFAGTVAPDGGDAAMDAPTDVGAGADAAPDDRIDGAVVDVDTPRADVSTLPVDAAVADTNLRCLAPLTGCGGGPCVNLETSVAHCGACGQDCALRAGADPARVSCVRGVCVFGSTGCLAGRGDCNANAADGCEALLDTGARCGGCEASCREPTPSCGMVAGVPTGYACVSGCASPTPTRCGTSCVNPDVDVRNCGGCGNACSGGANATAVCSASTCALSCQSGFGNCDLLATNGCEVDLRTAATNCGSCGHRCAAGESCAAGVCGPPCAAGTSACAGRCVDLASDSSHCGACGRSCVGAQWCVSGACAGGPHYSVDRAPVFPYVDACGAPGSQRILMGEDDIGAAATMPFAMRWWGAALAAGTPMYINANGNVQVGTSLGAPNFMGSIPSTEAPDSVIALQWCDLVQRTTGVCVATVGTAPSRRWVAQYVDAAHLDLGTPTGSLNFEVIVHEGSGVIDFAYGAMSGAVVAAVGLENPDGTEAVSLCASGSSCTVVSNARARFTPIP